MSWSRAARCAPSRRWARVRLLVNWVRRPAAKVRSKAAWPVRSKPINPAWPDSVARLSACGSMRSWKFRRPSARPDRNSAWPSRIRSGGSKAGSCMIAGSAAAWRPAVFGRSGSRPIHDGQGGCRSSARVTCGRATSSAVSWKESGQTPSRQAAVTRWISRSGRVTSSSVAPVKSRRVTVPPPARPCRARR